MISCGIISRFQLLSPRYGQIAHALLTRPPCIATFDLHVLSTPPAFILSQNQTLELIGIKPILKDLRTEALSRLFFSHYLCWLCFVVLMYFKVIDRNFLSNLNLKEFISFYSIFNLRFRTSVRCSLRGSSFILSHWFLFVKRFSEVFQIFWSFLNFIFYLKGLNLNFFSDELLFRASSFIISHWFLFVKRFSEVFSDFFEVLFELRFSSERLEPQLLFRWAALSSELS